MTSSIKSSMSTNPTIYDCQYITMAINMLYTLRDKLLLKRFKALIPPPKSPAEYTIVEYYRKHPQFYKNYPGMSTEMKCLKVSIHVAFLTGEKDTIISIMKGLCDGSIK